MKKVILLAIWAFIFSTQSIADCIPQINDKISEKKEKQILTRIKHKSFALGTGFGVGGLNAVFWGSMFKLIADGATIPASILVGAGYGVVTGGATVAIIATPMVAYDQIIRLQILKMKKTKKLLSAAAKHETNNKLIKKLYKNIKKKKRDITIEDIISDLNYGNESMAFCPNSAKKVYSINRIEKYLLGHNFDTPSTIEIQLVTDSGDSIEL